MTKPSLDETIGAPLLQVGTFGTHIMRGPTGCFIFRGTLPVQLQGVVADTYAEAALAFRAWFRAMPANEQREHAGNLRNDVFAFVFSNL